jgi:amino acid adenylation domain-containing protein
VQELQLTLEKALEFLLNPAAPPNPKSLRDSFYAHATGMDRNLATDIWESRSMDDEFQPFPVLPVTKYSPCADETVSVAIPRLSWPQNDYTISTVLSGALALLFRSYTNTSGSLIGICAEASVMPLPIHLEQDMTVKGLLQNIQKDVAHMAEFDRITLSQIRRLGNNAQRACEFRTIVKIGQNLSSDFRESLKNTYPLQVSCRLERDGANLELNFDRNIVEANQARRIVNQLAQVLERICEKNSRSSSVFSIETTSKQDIEDIHGWNRDVPSSVDRCVHDIITEMASQQQTASAIDAWDGKLTYGQLDQFSTQLAYHFVSIGVRKGLVVPLCFPKSVWMPVAALAVMKAGGAFIALDTNLPTRRLQDIAEHVGSEVVITASGSKELADCLMNSAVVVVDADTLSRLPTPQQSPLPRVRATDPLYVVSTSGSTGKPKFPSISHSNFASAIYHQRSIRALDKSCRAYDFASYAFDAALSNLIHVLAAGGCLCIPSEEQRKSDLITSMNEFQITYADLTPSTARLLSPKLVPTLKVLILAGEPVTAKDITTWSSQLDLKVLYGPAECSVAATGTAWNKGCSPGEIGSGIGLCTWVVDINSGCLAPVGAVGELWLEGPLVGDGYFQDPERTSEAFIEDPSWLPRKGRLYRTGDLVRYNEDGILVFVGRKDAQVKLRGQRIEPGEIEHYAGQLFQENERAILAAEVIRPKGSEAQLLALFFHVANRPSLANITEDIVETLAKALPSYMVPSTWIFLEEFPITATGKIDRRKIREVGSSMSLETLMNRNQLRSTSRQKPQTPHELQLQSLWASVLNIPASSISANDNFLRIGDSIHAMKLTSATRKIGFSLSVADVFKHPRLSDMAKKIQRQQTTNNTILPFSLLKHGLDLDETRLHAANLCGVSPTEIEDVLPTTPLQAGLLALTQRHSGDYIMRQALELRENINIDKFKSSWEAVVAATPILRTRIADLPGQGLAQIVIDEGVDWIQSNNLENITHGNELHTVEMGESLAKYGLVTDENKKTTWFVLTLHHAVYDGWSVEKLFGSLEETYQQKKNSTPSTPFQKFVQYTKEQTSELAKGFWSEYLGGSETAQFPALPSSKYDPRADKKFNHTVKNIDWSYIDVTPATAIRTAWGILQSSHTGLHESIFGAVVNGRQAPVPNIENLIGPTITTVPVRVVMKKNDNTTQLLQRVQEDSVNMIPYEQTGLQNIRNIEDLSQASCDFQTLLVIQPEEPATRNSIFTGNTKGAEEASTRFSSYAIVVDFELKGQSLGIQATFDSHVIEEQQVRPLILGFERVLRQVCTSQDSAPKVMDIDVLGKAELENLWKQNSNVPLTINKCVHDLIISTAGRQPDEVAVSAWDGEWTYRELEQLSARVAARLVESGVKSGEIIPLCFEKSKWMPIATCGVMRAGGVCLALDSNQPELRLQTIVQQVHPKTVLSSLKNESLSKKLGIQSVILIDDTLPEAIHTVPLPKVDPESPLFVLFTSGSTGTPKGVVINHNNFASAIFYHGKIFDIGPGQRIFDFASYSFDISWFNALQSFSHGGCLCVPSEDERQNGIAGSLRRYKSTIAFLTPTVLRLLKPEDCPDLKLVALGGEPQRWSDFEPWVEHVKTLTVYGPAESTVVSTATSALALKGSDFFIGSGEGLNLWIVDPQKSTLTPTGGVGEIWLEGPLVGQGYYNDTEKTTAAFVQDPCWLLEGTKNHPGRRGRLYRTGDLVRRNVNGTLTSVGRKDTQTKIRGQRVELGEVEQCIQHLLQHDSIILRAIAEVITPNGGKDSLLVAFLHVPDTTETTKDLSITVAELEDRMTSLLPSYMVPSAWVPLAKLPITVNGKTDRRSLRQDGSKMKIDQLHTLRPRNADRPRPETPMEKTLQILWASVLEIEPSELFANDSFFRLGGDSVAAMRFVAAARRANIQVTVAEVFKQPRLHDLAASLVQNDTKLTVKNILPFSLLKSDSLSKSVQSQAAGLCGVNENIVTDVYPCTGLQEGLLAMTAKNNGHYVAHFKIPLQPGFSVSRFKSAWSQLVSETAILRTRIVDLPDQGLVQVVLQDVQELKEFSREEIYHYNNAFLPGLGSPLMQAALVKETAGTITFEWTLHHAVYDGWSMQLLLESLESAYFEETRHLLTPFNSFVKYLHDRDEESEVEHWNSMFENFNPQQFPKLPSTSYQPKPDSMKLHTIENLVWPEGDITVSAAVKTAWAILVSRYTDSSDVAFGIVTAGRQAAVANIESIAGPTIATVPLVVHIDGKTRVENLLIETQKRATDTIPFEQRGITRIQRFNSSAENACQFQSLLMIQPAEQKRDKSKLYLTHVEDNLGPDATTAAQFNTYALMLWCQLGLNTLNVQVSYDSHVISDIQIERLLRQFEDILRQTSLKNTAVKDIRAVSEKDLQDIWKWNSSVPESFEACIHDLINDAALRYPDSQAVCGWDGSLTYKELNEKSTALAYRLLDRGMKPGSSVPLFFGKSKIMPISALAVMKAGGTCLALDINQPQQRLRTIVESMNPQILLTSAQEKPLASSIGVENVVTIEPKDTDETQFKSQLTLLPKVAPSSLLYIVFTSGSTGKPKGVAITHSNFASAVRHQQGLLGLDHKSRVYDFASYAFDVSWSNTLATMICGGCVCIPSEYDRINDLSNSMLRLETNLASLTPHVACSLTAKALHSLSSLQLTGEHASKEQIEHLSQFVDLRVAYGPAECTVYSTVSETGRFPSNIGKGVGTCTWVVDPANDSLLAPVGSVGELWLEGPLVAHGYFEDPDKTAASFVENPIWLVKGSGITPGRNGRLYKTGDLVRYNNDGTLAFLGRKDSQIKIRGQRVELAEIECNVKQVLSILLGSVQVIVDTVTVKNMKSPTLVAFVSSNDLDGAENNSLQARLLGMGSRIEDTLGEILPSYMIPSTYFAIDTVPLSDTGKTDRRRLRDLYASLAPEELAALQPSRSKRRLPNTSSEVCLQNLWASVLEVDSNSIDANDNFFRVGGDSITAMRLVEAARQQGFSLNVAEMFRKPRLEDMANALDSEKPIALDSIPPFSLLNDDVDPNSVKKEVATICNVNASQVIDVFPCTPLQT